jgi:hypothetical protein
MRRPWLPLQQLQDASSHASPFGGTVGVILCGNDGKRLPRRKTHTFALFSRILSRPGVQYAEIRPVAFGLLHCTT